MALIFKSSLRQRRYNYLVNAGFFPSEAEELSRTSRKGMSSPYFRRMVKSRRRTYDNAKQYGWSRAKYEAYIKQQYIDNGFLKKDRAGRTRIDPWQLLRYHEELSYRRGEEYESPWKKRAMRKGAKRGTAKRVTKQTMLTSWIAGIDKTIARTTNEERIERLQKQKARLQEQLDKLS